MRKIVSVATAALFVLLFSSAAMAAAEAAAPADSSTKAALALAAGLAIAIGAFGAALGQGRMAAAAMESIGRNPNAAARIQLPMILGLAFIEALALYAFVIAFFLQGKI
ncbi:MAG: ATP synthase F0 subunit C [Deltaproteobacteria bacterium]|nr:ATP synthase F0 subunit C [Deltaproteobacteria bacterium]MBI3060728.1 ATP synthase F0 subunit C [Deltaproteobacteria bacterium]